MSANNTKTSNVTEKKQFKTKEMKFGIENPLNATLANNPSLGPYILLSVHSSDSRIPIAEYVVSRHIGPSQDHILEKSYVINRRKDVPSLIRDVRNPSQSRFENIKKLIQRTKLEEAGYVTRLGDNWKLTEKANTLLSGNDLDHYLDRSIKELEMDRENKRILHEKGEEGKTFRFKKRFIYNKVLDDFMTKDEREVRGKISTIYNSPETIKAVQDATKTDYETLVDGEYPQKALDIGIDTEEMKPSELVSVLEKKLFQKMTQQKAKIKEEEKSALQIAMEKIAKLEIALKESEMKVEQFKTRSDVSSNEVNAILERLQTSQKNLETREQELNIVIEENERLHERVKELESSFEEEDLPVNSGGTKQ